MNDAIGSRYGSNDLSCSVHINVPVFFADRNISSIHLPDGLPILEHVCLKYTDRNMVLENIDRHRNMGQNAWESARQGTLEVAGAVTAS